MSENSISKPFYNQLLTVVAIVVATISGVRYAVNEGKEMIREEIKPIIDRVTELERKYVSLDDIMAINSSRIAALEVSVTHFVDNYNKAHRTAFLKPSDIELTEVPKKRKR